MRGAAAEAGMMLRLSDRLASVTSVGQFVELVHLSDKDVQMKKMVGQGVSGLFS